MNAILCYVVAAWSGFFVMGIELLGGRLLAPSFGSSIYVWGAIITVFMLALSIGYLAGWRYSVRSPNLVRLGVLLMVAGVTALPVIFWSVPLLDALAVAVPDPRFGSLLGATLLFVVPTFFSGMISPYCVRLLIDATSPSGRRAGQLHFVSTFGSAAGTLLTSFYFVLYFEVNTLLMAYIACSLVLGAAACLAGRNARAAR